MSQKKLQITIIMLLTLCLLLPGGALAYSYGDPNQEEVAESFKEIVVELNRNPIDWSKVEAIYKTRRAEISSHFGEDVALKLDVNLSDEDKDSFIANFKAVLGMNLKRRFDYSMKDFGDYAEVKLLVAKAKGTYDVLKPYLPSNETNALEAAFNDAYEALGNPGLFGVGEQPSNETVFKEQTTYILNTILPLFPFEDQIEGDSKPEQFPGVVEHAPMERMKKTNTAISIIIILVVIAIVGVGIWILRKRKLL
jgi:flagellar basal body-associated protein FliL